MNERIDNAKKFLAQCSRAHGWQRGNGKCVRVGRRVAIGSGLLAAGAIALSRRTKPATEGLEGAITIDSRWKTEKPKKTGSNPAMIFISPEGDRYYGKLKSWKESSPGFIERAKTEVLASNLYKLAGVDAMDTALGVYNGEPVFLSKMVDASPPMVEDNPKIRDGFIVDAWLANWDAPMHDNIVMVKGKPFRLDVGGSLDYRAKGGKKGANGKGTPFGEEVGELQSMQKKGKAADFRDMDSSELKEQAKRLGQVSDAFISNAVKKQFGESDRASTLSRLLIARKNNILEKVKA